MFTIYNETYIFLLNYLKTNKKIGSLFTNKKTKLKELNFSNFPIRKKFRPQIQVWLQSHHFKYRAILLFSDNRKHRSLSSETNTFLSLNSRRNLLCGYWVTVMDNVFNPRFTENTVTFFKWPFLESAFDNSSVHNFEALLGVGISVDNKLRQLRYVLIYDQLVLGMYPMPFLGRTIENQKEGLNFQEISQKWHILL